MKNILLIEDWQPIARAIKVLLEGAGYSVTWLVGAKSFQPTVGGGGITINGITADGQLLDVDCRQFQAAFVDGQLEGDIAGTQIVEQLVACGVACCGMSTEVAMNRDMVALGAKMAAKKPVVFAALVSKRLSVEAVCRPYRSQIIQLQNLEARFLSPEFADLRHEADARLKAAILSEDEDK